MRQKTRDTRNLPERACVNPPASDEDARLQGDLPAKAPRRSRKGEREESARKRPKSAVRVPSIVLDESSPHEPPPASVEAVASPVARRSDTIDFAQVYGALPQVCQRAPNRDGLWFLPWQAIKKTTASHLRFFDFEAWLQPVHWAKTPGEFISRPLQCLEKDCPFCQARMKPEMLVGLPVLDLDQMTFHTVSWSETSGAAASAPKANTLPDIVRAVILEGVPCIVSVTKGESADSYEYDTLRIEDVVLAFPSGDAEIEAFRKARAGGQVQLDLGKALTRSEILEQYPNIGRAAMLADHFKESSNDRADQIRRLFEKKKGESE